MTTTEISQKRSKQSTFLVEISEDRTGAVTVTPVREKIREKYAKHMKEMTGSADDGAFFQEGLDSVAEALELSSAQVKHISSGYTVRVKIDPWNFGMLLGYDANELDIFSTSQRKSNA
jgi:hypothetical protein